MIHHSRKTTQLNFPILLIVLTFITACAEAPQEDVLRFGLASQPTNLDPRFATDATSARLNRLLYARLIDFDKTAQPIPALATWKQISPTHYRFHLREGRRSFHHGPLLSSKDVKATYEYILNPANLSPHRNSLTVIAEIETPTDEIVDFHLTQPDGLFPSYLVIGILPANLIHTHHAFHENPIGSGPFTFVDRPDDTRWRLMRQIDDQLFEFVGIVDPTVRTLKLLAGEIDMLQNDLPPELIPYLAKNNSIKIHRRKGSNFSYLGFNLQDPIVSKHKIRQAIAHAIDRQSIIHHVFKDTAHAANALFPPNHWTGISTLSGYAYDPERSRTLLSQAGVDDDHPIHIIYKTSTDPFRLRLATILQHQLAQVGIRTSIHSHDWGTFYGDIKAGNFQMYSLSWVGLKTPDIFRYAFHSDSIPPRGANRGRFVDAHTDALIDQAQSTQNLQEKGKAYRQLQAHLLEALPYVPLWFEEHIFISRNDISGFTVSGDGNYDGLLNVNRTST